MSSSAREHSVSLLCSSKKRIAKQAGKWEAAGLHVGATLPPKHCAIAPNRVKRKRHEGNAGAAALQSPLEVDQQGEGLREARDQGELY